MSGGGRIIEKRPMELTDEDDPDYRRDVVRYWLLTGEYHDEVCVFAEPQEDEPSLGETIWWGGGRDIYWGPKDSKRLVKVGYSFSPSRSLSAALGDQP